jgi:hypothetical protein
MDADQRIKRLRWRLGELLCRLGIHSTTARYEDAYGSHGGDCCRCGMGPL